MAYLKDLLESFTNWKDYPVLQLLLVLCLAFMLAVLVRYLLAGLVTRLTRNSQTTLDDPLVATFNLPITMAILLAGIYYGTMNAIPELMAYQLPIRATMLSGVVLLWMSAFLRYSMFLVAELSSMEDRFKMVQPRTKPIFQIMFKTVIILGSIYVIILVWEQDVTGWLASAGVMGIAIGFAAKDTLANLISGIFILADAPYKIGDYIVLEGAGRGRVTDIGIRSTRLLTRDDVEVIIPNALIGNSRITNQSGGPHEKFRVHVPVGVAYGSDIDRVRQTLMDIAEREPQVMRDPKYRVRFRGLGDSSLDFELLVWVEKPELRGSTIDALLSDIYKTFIKENIVIPFPQRDVHLFNEV